MALTGLLLAAAFFTAPIPEQRGCSAEDLGIYNQMIANLATRRAEVHDIDAPAHADVRNFLDQRLKELRMSRAAACKPAG